MGSQSAPQLLDLIMEEDFDFSGSQIDAEIRYQGEMIQQSPVSLDLTGQEILLEAQLYGIPPGDDYALYMKHPIASGEFVFCPPNMTLSEVCESAGIDTSQDLDFQFEISPEPKGA